MSTSMRTLAAAGRVLGLGLLIVAAWYPTPAAAQPLHGAGINKACDIRCPGQDATCHVSAINLDDFGDSIRIDQLCDTVHHTGGDVTTCKGGGPFTLLALGDTVQFDHTVVVAGNDPNPLTDDGSALGVDLGTGLPVGPLTFPEQIRTFECCVDADCNDQNACTNDSCNLQTHTCQHQNAQAGTPCDADHDVCTVDQCNANGMCVVVGPSNDPACNCNALRAGPACAVNVAGKAKTYTTLQAAVNAAKNGTTMTPTVITVHGVCVGSTLVTSRSNLIIQGPTVPNQCPPSGNQLTGTLAGPSPAEVIKIVSCKNVLVRYLNIVHGDLNHHDGVEFKKSSNGGADCNCIALHDDEGVQVHFGKQVQVTGNRVASNVGAGIDIADTTTMGTISNNLSVGNGTQGILIRGTTGNTYTGNTSTMNGGSGFDLQSADSNQVTSNTVTNNTVAGIKLEAGALTPANGSDKNNVNGNTINSNGDALMDKLLCILGTMNTGNNATLTGCEL